MFSIEGIFFSIISTTICRYCRTGSGYKYYEQTFLCANKLQFASEVLNYSDKNKRRTCDTTTTLTGVNSSSGEAKPWPGNVCYCEKKWLRIRLTGITLKAFGNPLANHFRGHRNLAHESRNGMQ